MPESLAESRTAELLEGVCDVDLDALDVELPPGVRPRLNARRTNAHAGTMGESDLIARHARRSDAGEEMDGRMGNNIGWGLGGFFVGVFVMAVSIAVPPTGESLGEWSRDGTLHDANLAEWNRATAENRLATAADFAYVRFEDQLSPFID